MIYLLKKFLQRLTSQRWELGIIQNTLEDIVNNKPLRYQWIKNPYKDRWYADPFVLDVTDDKIFLLVEDMPINNSIFKKKDVLEKASISKLTVNRHTYEIEKREVILDLPTHLSFPNIIRYKGDIYVYPENVFGEQLNIYKYDLSQNKLIFAKTLINEPVWDSVITEYFGQPLCFTSREDDYHLDIYKWNEGKMIFEYWQSVMSDHRNMRMAGQLFRVGDKIYCPSQNSDRSYGNATEIKEVQYKDGKFSFETIRTLKSEHPTLINGMHTLNEYNGIIVIDVVGDNYPLIKVLLNHIRSCIK